MGIKSTRYITRQDAIVRIFKINELLKNKDYKSIEDITSEHDFNVQSFVDNTEPLDIYSEDDLEKWSDTMLSDKLDEPFYRFSMFDNYLISEDGEDDPWY